MSGTAWLDREWSSQSLAEDQEGWDWFSLSFNSGDELMGFILLGATDYTSATWISADGQATLLADGAFTAKPLSRHDVAGRVPTTWQVSLPSQAVEVRMAALNPDAWMQTSVPYWGAVTVTGSHPGDGYLEMTGYH